MDHQSLSHQSNDGSRANAHGGKEKNSSGKQPVRSFPAVSPTLQLFKNKEHSILGTGVQTTNGQYFLDSQMGNDEVYAESGATAPLYSKVKTANVKKTGISKYVPSSKFIADCLHTAEEIMIGHALPEGNINSKEKTKGNDFGNSEKDNWDTAMDVEDKDKDKKAKPGVGESYLIVEKKPRDIGGHVMCQYHAAAVVAQDGSDNVTLEVFGSPNTGHRTAVGKYAVYSTAPSTKQTFHTIWSGTFPNGVTITLETI
jgi:hypothetical protein